MHIDEMKEACGAVAKSIGVAMEKYREMEPEPDPVGAVCITLSDDFSWAGLVAISQSEFEGLEPDDRWDLYSWLDNGPGVDIQPLNDKVGEACIEEPEQLEACAYLLAALVRSMQMASAASALTVDGADPFLFCTMIDSEEELWFSHLSAQAITSSETFARYADELAKAQGCTDEAGPLADGNKKLQAAFAQALDKLA